MNHKKDFGSSKTLIHNEQGQAITEYILLLAIIIMAYAMFARMLSSSGLANRLSHSMTGPFASAYKYGLPTAKGWDEGGPVLHPRAVGGNNFRIFFNPKIGG